MECFVQTFMTKMPIRYPVRTDNAEVVEYMSLEFKIGYKYIWIIIAMGKI